MMAVTLESFVSQLPEFTPAPPEMIQARLDEAVRAIDPAIFVTKTDDAVRLHAAHALAMTPWGQDARLVSEAGETTYHKLLMALTRSMTPGFRVA